MHLGTTRSGMSIEITFDEDAVKFFWKTLLKKNAEPDDFFDVMAMLEALYEKSEKESGSVTEHCKMYLKLSVFCHSYLKRNKSYRPAMNRARCVYKSDVISHGRKLLSND